MVGIIAGGPQALTRSVEGAEDNARDAEQRLRRVAVGPAAVVCCIAASGVTPFARAALEYARFRRAATIFITCGRIDGVTAVADVVVELPTGPEVIAGSTRLKAGTATKIVLNAISTAAFVLLGKTYGTAHLTDRRAGRPTRSCGLIRAVRIVTSLTGLSDDAALKLIEKAGGRAKVALVMHHASVSAARARDLLVEHKGSLRSIVGDLEPEHRARPRTRGRRAPRQLSAKRARARQGGGRRRPRRGQRRRRLPRNREGGLRP